MTNALIDLEKAKEFNPAYLSGYLAERYDESAEEAFPRCKQWIERSAQSFCAQDIQMDSLIDQHFTASVMPGRTRYVMLPAWILYCTYKEKKYLFAMNGQTGKFVGNLPLDPLKTFLAGLCGTVVGVLAGLCLGVL